MYYYAYSGKDTLRSRRFYPFFWGLVYRRGRADAKCGASSGDITSMKACFFWYAFCNVPQWTWRCRVAVDGYFLEGLACYISMNVREFSLTVYCLGIILPGFKVLYRSICLGV